MEYKLEVGVLRKTLLWIIIVLLLLNIAVLYSKLFLGHGRLFGLVWLFNFNEEKNIPALFATFLILINSLLFYLLYKEGVAQPKNARWRILSYVFVFLALDELLSFHEELIVPLREFFDASGLLYFTWVIPYVIIVAALSIYMIPLFIKMDKKYLAMYLVSGMLFISGAVIVELFEGRHFERFGDDVWFYVYVTFEELLEITGMTLCMFTSIHYLHTKCESIGFFSIKVVRRI